MPKIKGMDKFLEMKTTVVKEHAWSLSATPPTGKRLAAPSLFNMAMPRAAW